MHNDDGRPTKTKRPGHLHFLPGSWSADLFILSAVEGLSSPASHTGWVIRAVWGVLWSDMGRDSSLSPSQKTSASLSSPAGSRISLTSVSASISVARLPPCGCHWKCSQCHQIVGQCLSWLVCITEPGDRLLSLCENVSRKCMWTWGRIVCNYSAPFLKGMKMRQKKSIYAKLWLHSAADFVIELIQAYLLI